jgi:hypothetical protein
LTLHCIIGIVLAVGGQLTTAAQLPVCYEPVLVGGDDDDDDDDEDDAQCLNCTACSASIMVLPNVSTPAKKRSVAETARTNQGDQTCVAVVVEDAVVVDDVVGVLLSPVGNSGNDDTACPL